MAAALDRRQLARLAALGWAGSALRLDAQNAPAAGPRAVPLDPSLAHDWLTPAELFFIREHFPAPALDRDKWRLAITGAVNRPLTLGFKELLARPRVYLPATLECAGNPAGGGLVSNGEWNGVRLAALLAEAHLSPAARFVRFVGADGDFAQELFYSRSIPLDKALDRDTLLAYGLNGRELPQSHGCPLRAVVPGWYAMDSVKWLTRIEALTEPDASPIMTRRYLREQVTSAGSVEAEAVTAGRVKSIFTKPRGGAILLGEQFVVRGFAWAGENRVQSVELSFDGGRSWTAAAFDGDPPRRYTWAAWSYEWRIERRGSYELVVRATDDQGRRQPPERPADRRDVHELNHWQRVPCVVR